MTSDQAQNQLQEPIVTSDAETVLPPYLAYVGINEAARLTGKGKAQIYRDIQAGKLSWNIEPSGKKQLQIADLDRVYKLKRQDDTGNSISHQNRVLPHENKPVTFSDTTETAIELAVLKAELKAKDDIIRRVEEEVRDLRQNRDRLLENNNRLTLLLTAPTAPAAEPPAPLPWYRKIFK